MMEITERELIAVEEIKRCREDIIYEIKKVIVGQEDLIDEVLIALFSKGHCLLVGVPGLAKTLFISTLSQVLDLKFNRIQFTPDLMPSDITGTDILEEDPDSGRRKFRFLSGPIFTNILLADEINRTPPKTQAALLQAMQEYKVTASGNTFHLDLPFFVLATQNPIEHEGTYPLPEAQLDRFMFNVDIDYPPINDEIEIVAKTTSAYYSEPKKVLDGIKIIELQNLVRRVPVSNYVINYAVSIVRCSRPKNLEAPSFVKDWVQWGAGPRASQYLILGAKARAVMHGRYTASIDDVMAVAEPVLKHRIITNFKAQADGIGSTEIIERILKEIKPDENLK